MKTAFTARRLYTPIEEIQNPLLVVEDGLISEVSSRSMKEVPGNTSLIDFGDTVLAPGLSTSTCTAELDWMRCGHCPPNSRAWAAS